MRTVVGAGEWEYTDITATHVAQMEDSDFDIEAELAALTRVRRLLQLMAGVRNATSLGVRKTDPAGIQAKSRVRLERASYMRVEGRHLKKVYNKASILFVLTPVVTARPFIGRIVNSIEVKGSIISAYISNDHSRLGNMNINK